MPLTTELLAAPLGSGDNKVQGYNYRLCVTQNASNMVPFPKPANYNTSEWELLRKLVSKALCSHIDALITSRCPGHDR
jgi:hypothetical protein